MAGNLVVLGVVVLDSETRIDFVDNGCSASPGWRSPVGPHSILRSIDGDWSKDFQI